jgi:predicted dehydrogenase
MDLIHVLFKADVESVSADIRSLRFGADTAAVQCRLATGAPVQSFFSTVAPAEDRWEVVGTAARIKVDREHGKVTVDHVSGPEGRIASLRKRMASAIDAFRGMVFPNADPSHERSLTAFIESVRSGTADGTAADPADGWRSLCLVLAAEASAQDGRTVDPRAYPGYSRGSAGVN